MKISAGLVIYRYINQEMQIFLEHPGGPFFAQKDEGCWSIPKGEVEEGESLLDAAFRETKEETGQTITGKPVPLVTIKTPAKTYHAWAIESDIDISMCKSNTFELHGQTYPEVDKYGWFDIPAAKTKINQKLTPFVTELALIKATT